jgi:NADH-quinone oxidoreductase subunit E
MLDRDDDTTIGRGGWALVLASGLIFFVVLRYVFHYLLFPSLAFALAIALIVLLILYRLAVAVNRHDDAEAERHVRRIVPASTLAEGTTRVSGIEGAQASPVVAVPVRPDPAVPSPQRPAAMVTPLAKVEPAPLIMPRQAAPTLAPAARAAQTAPIDPVEAALPGPSAAVAPVVPASQPAVRTAAKQKAEARPTAKPSAKSAGKSGTRSRAGDKSAAKPAKEVAASEPATAKTATAKPVAGFKGKAELEAKAAVPVAAAAPEVAKKTKASPKARAAAKPKATKAPTQGLVRLTAPRGGKADDLKMIDGVGPALEKLVNSLGFYHFDQIAAWTEADVALVDAEMKSFKGRATRDKWVLQAKILANGGTAEEAAAAAKA